VKYLIPLALLATLLLFACGDNSISPIETDNHSYQLSKIQTKSELTVGKIFSISKTINGDKGGTIKLKKSYVAEDGHKVKIDVKFKVKKHSFKGKVAITMWVDENNAAVWFTPHMVFNKPTELDVKFEGIEINELKLTNGNYDFVFINDNDSIEEIDHNGVKVKENKGKISVKKAKLNHFSRYAFSR
jgi:major membrane immunogen (membrane-anchored lipoprotein)